MKKEELPMHKDTYYFGYGIDIEKPDEMARQIIKLEKENQQLKDLIVEKNNQLNDMQSQHTDYTQVNILKMKLETSEKARKEAIEFINDKSDKGYNFGWILQNEEIDKLLEILDIDKGE